MNRLRKMPDRYMEMVDRVDVCGRTYEIKEINFSLLPGFVGFLTVANTIHVVAPENCHFYSSSKIGIPEEPGDERPYNDFEGGSK